MPPAPLVWKCGCEVAKWRGVSENCGCQVAKWRCVSENRLPRRLPEAGPGGAQEAPEVQKSLPRGSPPMVPPNNSEVNGLGVRPTPGKNIEKAQKTQRKTQQTQKNTTTTQKTTENKSNSAFLTQHDVNYVLKKPNTSIFEECLERLT